MVNEKLANVLEDIQSQLGKIDAVNLDDKDFEIFRKSREFLRSIESKLNDL